MTYYVIPIYVWHPPSLALKGRHNTAQGVNPVYAIYPQKTSSPPRANGAWRGGGNKWAIHDRAYALSYAMSPF